MARVFSEHGAKEVFSTDDPVEAEGFIAARRFCIPAVEAKGHCCSRTSGCRCPGWRN